MGTEKQLSDATAQVEALKTQVEELSSGAGAQVEELSKEAAAAAKAHADDQAKIVELTGELDKARSDAVELTKQLDKARSDAEEAAKQQGEAKVEVERLNAELVTSVAG